MGKFISFSCQFSEDFTYQNHQNLLMFDTVIQKNNKKVERIFGTPCKNQLC